MGYYRINYSPSMWLRFLESDLFNNLPNLNRAQLYDDSLNLARAGKYSMCSSCTWAAFY